MWKLFNCLSKGHNQLYQQLTDVFYMHFITAYASVCRHVFIDLKVTNIRRLTTDMRVTFK